MKNNTELKEKFCTATDIDGIASATEAIRDAGGKFQCGKIIVMPVGVSIFNSANDLRDACNFLAQVHGYRIQ